MFFEATHPCMNTHFPGEYARIKNNIQTDMHILNEKTIRISPDHFYFPQKRLYLNY